ncbi:putative dioxygenase [Coleophoma crateriformis]|uniref:Putative dioxygenase n=1 Tax=Coleophoma crateriformis TaxID=565419 RepID=A0A3D8S3E4_9HELO|nr:putative dioxygenase [Coleophoma crateriformis]
MAIQTLDYRDFQDGSPERSKKFCQALCKTLSTWGFAKIRNSTIPDAVIDELFKYNKRFFALPEQIKQKAAHPAAPNPHRGWSAVGQEQLSRIAGFEKDEEREGFVPEFRESFDQGAADDELFPNRWVDESDLPGFRKFMENYYDLCHNFHNHLLRAISAGLNLPEDLLLSRHQTDTSELRIIHYPSIPCEHLKSAMRIGEHSDFGTLTLLLQDSVGGLQVEDQKSPGTFIPVESDSIYEIIINVGDCLQRWTNKELQSANHRVHLPEGQDAKSGHILAERYSVAYFGKPDREVLVDTLPEFCRGGKSRYNDHMNALQYNQTKLLRTYA